ncbi:integrase [Deinococcus aerolatus]|uniref:Integrase n=1 Tax=Deinococcus aerolatus TaxID=522487 RepID=A0ABQ2GGL9_9DEIO|nr:site-specific integrase [Deinococcus aerolatus]GGL94501.1 integrase [Deinococcus aerolatus]
MPEAAPRKRTKAPNGAASLRPYKGQYRVKVTVAMTGGRQQQVSRVVPTEAEARLVLAQLLTDHSRGLLRSPHTLTVEALLGELIAIRRDEWKPKTLANNEDLIRLHLAPHLGPLKVQKLKPQHIQQLYLLLARTYSLSLLRQVRALLRQALQLAVVNDLVPRNVAKDVELLGARVPRRVKQNRALSPEHLEAFLQAAAPFEEIAGPVFHIAGLLGLRRGEAAALRWEQVDLGRGLLHVRDNLVVVRGRPTPGTPKTEAGDRTVPLAPETVALLAAWKVRQQALGVMVGTKWIDSGHIFTTLKGTPFHPDRLSTLAREFGTRAGLEHVTFHGLRHTSASLHLARGVPAEVVKTWLGHENVSLTLNTYRTVYSHEHRLHVTGMSGLLQQGPDNLTLDGVLRVGA